MGSAAEMVTHHRSGAQAASRAEECHRRLARLRAGDVRVDSRDLEAAQNRLADARRRASAASQRLQQLQLRQASHVSDLSLMTQLLWRMPPLLLTDDDGEGPAQRLLQAVAEGRCEVTDLWLEFMSLGGEAEALEFEAYMHGAWAMSSFDRSVLAHLWWEHEEPGQG